MIESDRNEGTGIVFNIEPMALKETGNLENNSVDDVLFMSYIYRP